MQLTSKLMVFFKFCQKSVLDLSSIDSNIQLFKQLSQFQKEKLYLVGGSVRDLILNRPTADLDFIVAQNAINLAKKFAQTINGTFIQLETDPPTARIINKHSQSTTVYDLAQFRGPDLASDLRQRDLTINAIAYDLEEKILIDPCDGQQDLIDRVVRFPSRQVISDDPLRMLRLFRLSAQLDFRVSTESIQLVESLAGKIKQSATERIRDELLKTLATDSSALILDQMQDTGLLPHILPVSNYKIISKRIRAFELETIPSLLADYLRQIDPSVDYFRKPVASDINRATLTKLSLMAPLEQLKTLSLGRKVEQLLSKWFSSEQLFPCLGQDPTNFLRRVGDEWLGVVARKFATIKTSDFTNFDPIVLSLAACYYERIRFVWQRGPLLTGKQLIENFGVAEGPKIGEILAYLEDLQFAGSIRTHEQAYEAVINYLGK